jgi:PPE-repeat protein
MKKTIRLTESELTNLIKRIIKEQGEVTSNSNEFIGKTVTLYTSKEDAASAANSGKSNPQAEGSLVGSIVSIDKITSKGLELLMNFSDLSSDDAKKYIKSGGNNVIYNRQFGHFSSESIGPVSVYYNESLKRALDKKYFQTDFASTKKPSSTQAITESQLARLAKKIVAEAVGKEPILDKKNKIFGNFFFGEGKTKPSSFNGRPVTQADVDYLVKEIAMFIKNSGTLDTLQNFSRGKVGVSKNAEIPKFITLSIGTSHTGSGETNSSVAQGRYNFLAGMVMKAFDSLGVDSAIAKSVVITSSDSAYRPSNLDKNFFDPKKVNPDDIERYGAITITPLVTKGMDTRGIQGVQGELNSASSIINTGLLDFVDEDKIVRSLLGLETFSDIKDLDDAISAQRDSRFNNLESFINTQLFDDKDAMRTIATHFMRIAKASGKQSDTVRMVGNDISIGLGR